MLKSILQMPGVHQIDKKQQKAVNGGLLSKCLLEEDFEDISCCDEFPCLEVCQELWGGNNPACGP